MDFNEEIAEFITNKYIVSFQIHSWINAIAANCEIITLESISLQFVWSKTEAIKLISVNHEKVAPSKRYEVIEQMLSEYSEKYRDAFGGDLFAKLTKLKAEQESEEADRIEEEENENDGDIVDKMI